MQVAVAGVKDVGDAQAVARAELAHALQHQRQARARDGAVHAVVVRRDAADRREGRLAPGPERQSLRLALADPAGHRALGLEIGRHTSELQSLMRISYAVLCLKKKKKNT